MDNFKGTPGPWVYDSKRSTHDSIIHTVDAKEEYGYISQDNGGVVGSSEWIWIKDADATLISAAPDMLKALEQLVHLHMCEQEGMSSGQPSPADWYEAVDKASEAISKALGKEVSDGTA
jgi:hypothetical protein